MDGSWDPDHSKPDSATKVNNPSLDKELSSASIKEMEEPLLGGVGSVVPDVTSCVG